MRIGLIILFIVVNTFLLADTCLITLGDVEKLNLVYPHQVIEGPDMNIYVYDEKDSFIKVFSSAGKLVKTICGSGEGPGYIKRPDGVNFGFTSSNFIYFSEFFNGHRWITILNPNGTLKEIVTPQIDNLFYGVQQIFALQDGSFLIELAFVGIPKKKENYFLHSASHKIYHMNGKGEFLTKLKETDYYNRISFYSRGADMGLPYTPHNLWSPYGDNFILFTDGMDNTLLILDYKGNTIDRIETELPSVPVITDQDLVKWRTIVKEERTRTQSDRERYNRFGKVIEEYKTPLYKKKPYISSLRITPDGNILVSSTIVPENKKKRFWLLNSKGKITAHGKANYSYLRISPHYIFIMKSDEDDNIEVCFMKRAKDEINDFNKLFLLANN